jgi:phosphate starvation-inducible protein PhoH
VIVRSAVQGRDIGALPGDISEKTDMFQQPYIEICNELFGPRKQAYERLVEQGNIEFLTTSFLRGITIKNAILIVDEAQNLNWQEISSIMTRAGTHAKIIFCGDFRQTDLSKKNDLSGLKKFIAISRMMPSFRSVEFGVDDIVRSDIVKEFVMAMMRYDDTHDPRSSGHESQ